MTDAMKAVSSCRLNMIIPAPFNLPSAILIPDCNKHDGTQQHFFGTFFQADRVEYYLCLEKMTMYNRVFYVYIMTNVRNTVLYVGVTNNLRVRVGQHRSGTGSTFTSRYKATKLVYFEMHQRVLDAIGREKQLKAGSRQAKVNLIESVNPQWRDVSPEIPY